MDGAKQVDEEKLYQILKFRNEQYELKKDLFSEIINYSENEDGLIYHIIVQDVVFEIIY